MVFLTVEGRTNAIKTILNIILYLAEMQKRRADGQYVFGCVQKGEEWV